MQKLIARILLPIFTIWSVVTPMMAEANVLPFPTGAAMDIVIGGSEFAAGSASAPVVAIALGAVGLYLLFHDGSGNAARIPLGSAVPVPSAAATAAQNSSTTYGYNATGCASAGSGFASLSAADIDVVSKTQASCGSAGHSFTPCNNGTSYGYSDSGTNGGACTYTFQFTTASTPSCPTGYTASGSTCNLSNPYQASRSTNSDIVRNGNAYSVPYGAPISTPAGLTPHVMQTTTSNDTVTVQGTNADGSRQQTVVTALPGGGTLITQNTPKLDANGNSYMQVTQTTLDASGNVVQNAQTTTQQQFSIDPATGLATLTGSGASTNPASNPSAVTFPTDYARQGEAANAAKTITDQTTARDNAALQAITPTPTPLDYSLPKLGIPTSNPFTPTTPTALNNLALPSNQGTCVSYTAHFLGNDIVLDPCALVTVLRPLVDYGLMALGTLGGILVWLKSDEVSA
jgi:hypothetical protein